MQTGRPSKRKRSVLGTRLAALREEAGLTQGAVAAALGVRQQVVAYMERAAVALRPEHAAALAKLFEISLGELLGVASAGDHGPGPTNKVQRLCAEIGRLPRPQQDQIVKVVAALVEQAKES